MEKELATGDLAQGVSYKVEIKEGKINLELNASASVMGAHICLALDSAALIDAISAAIPGKIDDAILGVLKSALLEK